MVKLKNISTIILIVLVFQLSFGQESKDELVKKMVNIGELKMSTTRDTIPIEIWNDLIILKVRADKKEGYFLWDNGFSFSALDKDNISGIQLTEVAGVENLKVTDVINNSRNMNFKMLNSIVLGKTTINNSPFLLTDLKKIFLGKNNKLMGVLGTSIIRKLNWKFNFDENYVIISENEFDDEGINIQFSINEYNKMHTIFGINGHVGPAEIDFGYNSNNIAITKQALPLFAKVKKHKYVGQSVAGISGLSVIDTSYTVSKFDYFIGDENTTVTHEFKIDLLNSEGGLRIGNRFFRNYNCVINTLTKRIILLKRKTLIKEMPKKNYGFFLAKINDKIQILIKSDNLNAIHHPNLQLLDEIIELNGKKTKDFGNNNDLRDFQINCLKNNKNLVLKRVDGKVFTLSPQNDLYN